MPLRARPGALDRVRSPGSESRVWSQGQMEEKGCVLSTYCVPVPMSEWHPVSSLGLSFSLWSAPTFSKHLLCAFPAISFFTFPRRV